MFSARSKLASSTLVSLREPVVNPCRYDGHKCSRERVANERFCLRHLPIQRDSAFKQCNYVSAKSSIRCPNRLDRSDCHKDGLCLQHARMISAVRRRIAKKQRCQNSDYLKWQALAHYSAFPTARANDGKTEYHSESSDSEELSSPATVDSAAKEISDEEFDGPDEPLRRAGFYTTDEVTMMTRDKLLRLQSLYMEEIRKLQHQYVERKSHYAPLIKAEEAGFDTKISSSSDTTDLKTVRKLEAMQNYRRFTGQEKLMRKRWSRPTKEPVGKVKLKCKETDCHSQPMVASRYCHAHILNDRSQRLFKKCNHGDCREAVLRSLADSDIRCDRHQTTV